jgi:hypothetical protein
MALIGNVSILHKSPAKYTTGTVGFNDRANWNKPGMMRSRGNLTVSLLWKYDAVPSGFYAGRAFFPPQKVGRGVTRGSFAINGASQGALGLPGGASASITFDAAAAGGLISGGVANATITISGSADGAGLAAGSANGSITLTGTAALGAIAWGIATGQIQFSGAVQPFAYAHGEASTIDNSVMTPTTVATAVWEFLINGGTTQAQDLLATAGSGGVDYDTLWASMPAALKESMAAYVLAAAQTTPIHSNIKRVNDVTVAGAGIPPTFDTEGTMTDPGDPWRPSA